jgi:hypothetical protein
MRVLTVSLLSVAVLLSMPASGQDDESFSLGGARLVLGMPEATVRRQLGEDNIITGGIVTSKIGPPFRLVGWVQFQDGKLSWASKDLIAGVDQRASVEVIQRIISIIGDRRGCSTSTKIDEVPTLRTSLLVIRCSPLRQLQVSVSQAPGHEPFVNIDEYFGPR